MAKIEPTFTSFLKGAKGELLEIICDGSTSSFVIFKDGKPDFIDQYECNGRHYLPYPPTDGLLQNKAVLLPTNIGDYKDEKELIDEVRSFIHRYVGINDFFESIATYYVLFSWLYDCFSELPYLRAIGDYGSGKSRFLKTIGSLCYKPMFTAGASSVSTIFRIIDKFRGTLVLDEADMRWSDTKAEIVKILNCGFTDNTPVMRSIEIKNKGYDVQSFHVYCPKIVATRERFQDKALESRFLVEEMDSDNRRSDIPINLSSTTFEDDATEIRNKLLMWRFRNYGIKRIDTSLIDETLEPRLNQIMLPLMSIIGDENTRTELKNFVSGYNKQLIQDRGFTLEADILDSMITIKNTGSEEATIKNITETLNAKMGTSEKPVSSKKVGYIVRNHLKLETARTREGYTIDLARSAGKIKKLSYKYGVDYARVNIVNDAGAVDSHNDEIKDSDIPF